MKKLKKELSLFTATFYGIGIILGAGIYVLIGEGAGIAGDALWMAFALAALLATFTGLSYAELSSMFPRSAAEFTFMREAFGNNALAFSVQWIMLVALIVSVSTVALGFGGYFHSLFGVSQLYASMGLIGLMSLINYIGIKESTKFNIFSTSMEMIGLVIVIAIGAFFVGRTDVNYLAVPGGFDSIIAASSLIFFAYIGFEELVNLSEETKDATRVIPKALIISVAVTTVLYMLVSVAAVSVIGWEALAASNAPMTAVVASVIPSGGIVMSLIALFATANTVLAMMIVASRMMYGLSYNKMIPSLFSKVGKRQTPYNSILLVLVVSLAALSIGGIKTIALLTDIGIFLVYIFINSALLRLRFKLPKTKRPFRSPLNIGKVSILASLGLVTSVLMLYRFDPALLAYEVIIVILGLGLYLAYSNREIPVKIKARLLRKSVYTNRKSFLTRTAVIYNMRVADVMTKEVKTVKPADTIKRAAGIMERNDIGSVIVVDNGEAVGIITETNILKRVVAKGKDPAKTKCADVMSSPLVVTNEDEDLLDALDIMIKHNIKKLVIVSENGELMGIVTTTDIMKSGQRLEGEILEKLSEFLPIYRPDAS